MTVVAIGLDLVDVASFSTLYGDPETDLLRVFTENELEDAGGGEDRFAHLAARFAAKEAVLKALGSGLQDGIALSDISIQRISTGAPALRITGGALKLAQERGIGNWLVSLTQSEAIAAAVVIALSVGEER